MIELVYRLTEYKHGQGNLFEVLASNL